MTEPLLDIAREILEEKHPISFSALFQEVCDKAGLDMNSRKSKISRFYSSLTMDGRFLNIGENTWDLKSRHTFDESHIDIASGYSDEDDEDDEDDDSEEFAYKSLNGKSDSDESDEDDSEEKNQDLDKNV